MAWVDFDGHLHTWTLDPTRGSSGVFVYHRAGPTVVTKRYILADVDIEQWWPEWVRTKLTQITGVHFDELLAMRKDEKESEIRRLEVDTRTPRSTLECFYTDEMASARELGMDFRTELDLYNRSMKNGVKRRRLGPESQYKCTL